MNRSHNEQGVGVDLLAKSTGTYRKIRSKYSPIRKIKKALELPSRKVVFACSCSVCQNWGVLWLTYQDMGLTCFHSGSQHQRVFVTVSINLLSLTASPSTTPEPTLLQSENSLHFLGCYARHKQTFCTGTLFHPTS